MSELNQLLQQSERTATNKAVQRRALAAVSAVVLMIALVSLTLTTKVSAVGQLTITVSNAGLTPTSATVSGGIVHLKIENQSSRETLTLRLSRENGQLVREVVLPEGTRELSTEVELGAGQYTMTETSNTSWTCALTVQ